MLSQIKMPRSAAPEGSMESHLFTYYPKKDLELILDALHSCVGLYIQLLDENGDVLLSYGEPAPFCARAEACLPEGSSCREEHCAAGKLAIDLGEPYVFCCHSGLYHITYPIVNRDRLFGSVLLGPFLMDGTDEDLIKHLAKTTEIPTDTVLELYKYTQTISELAPDEVVKVSRLLFYLVNSLVTGSVELQKANRERLLHQSRVSEAIQRYKQEDPDVWKTYPFEKERLLLSETRAGNMENARAAYNDLMAHLILYEHYDADDLKYRLIELCSLLSRSSIERGADATIILDLNKKLIQEILNSYGIDEITYKIHDNLDIFTESLFFTSEKNNKLIRKTTEYIHSHSSEKLSLSELAKTLGITAPYLSMLFKQITGLTFRDYLNKVRVEEAKRLLISTDYQIMEIAVACGFNDQSYFTKVFKKYTGLSPRNFR